MKNIVASILLVFLAVSVTGQNTISGLWKGHIVTPDNNLGIEVKIEKAGALLQGWLDIPAQSARGLQLSNIRQSRDSLCFEFKAGPALMEFLGKIRMDSISGEFKQQGFTSTFSLVRDESEGIRKENFVSSAEDIEFFNGDMKLSGTLSFPNQPEPYPAVVLISGSGGQTRDCEYFGFKIFEQLASFLNEQGYAVLRYDDRGIGLSQGSLSDATTFDFADDAARAIEYLRSRSDIDKQKIGLLGHSEGAIIAAHLAAKDSDLTFIIALAGPALPGKEVLITQVKLIAEVGKHTKEELDKALFQITHPDNSPWMKAFVNHNPAEDWKQVLCPVLAFFGEKDLKVDPQANKSALESCFKQSDKTNYKILVLSQANHLFQEAKTGLPEEFIELKSQFVDGFLHAIGRWLSEL